LTDTDDFAVDLGDNNIDRVGDGISSTADQ